MIESFFSLRFLLLAVGAIIVVAIYLVGSRKSNRNRRVRFEQQRPTFKPRRRGGAQATTHSEEAAPATGMDLDDVPLTPRVDDIVVAAEEPALELPSITRSGEAEAAAPPRMQENQMELTFEDEPPAPVNEDDQTIIALFIRPPDGHEFAGPAIVQAMNSVGLRHGDMKIFHHYGAGELRTDAPLFSVANMVEPGHFDLEHLSSFATPGLAMFLQLPGPLDGAVAFELFLNTAQRLAEALSGDLYSAPQVLLDGVTIDKMRQQATPYTNVR